jgi:metal-responsive CopG/Arc/MetJ family transcriptional regulator
MVSEEYTTVSFEKPLLDAVDKVVEGAKNSYGGKQWKSRAAFVKEAVEEKLEREAKRR